MFKIYLTISLLCCAFWPGKILAVEKKCNYDFDLREYPQTYQGKYIVPRPNIAYADSSEVMREKKMFYLHISAGLIAYEVSAAYYFNPDLLFNLNFLYQKDAIFGVSRLYTLSATHFVGDVLYFRGGPAYRQGQTVNFLNSLKRNYLGKINTTDYGVDLAVGTRWQWQNLSIGSEWFAVYIPVFRDSHRDFDFQFRLAMMHVGISF